MLSNSKFMKKPFNIFIITALSSLCGLSALADDSEKVTQLRDVEIVSVKQMPVNILEPVSRLDSAIISSTNVKSMKGVSEIAPNIYMPEYGSRMTSSIYVRGLGTRIDQPVVGLNVDNVPYLNKDNYDFELIDLERIEVIRGSSGVLNGRNALGGQINITTLSPWKFNGVKAIAEYGKANTARIGAGWFGKLSEKLATSVTGYYNHTDGFFHNQATGNHVGGENAGGARWKMSWHPQSRWSLMNVASVTAGRQNGYPYASTETGLIAYNDPSFYRRTNFTDGLTASYTGNRMIATSITSVQYSDDNMTLDQDFLPEDYFTITQKRREWTLTQDIFAKGTRGHYNWLLGAFGFYKSGEMNAPVTFLNTGLERLIEGSVNKILPANMVLRWDERSMLLGNDFDTRNGGFALYHQSAYSVGNFTFQLGLRWDIEHVALDYRSDVDASVTMYRTLPTGAMVPLQQRPLTLHDSGSLSQTYNEILPQVAVGYNVGDWELSARVAKGYKAGGFNTQMFSDVLQQQLMETVGVPVTYDIEGMLTYKPEKAWTYEVSANFSTPSRNFSSELVLFLMAVRDQQLTVFPEGNTTGRAMTNAGRTRSLGVEWTGRWSPINDLNLIWSYGFTNAVFTKYSNGVEDLEGKRLPYAPAHTLFIKGGYDLPMSFRDVKPSVNIYTRGVGDICWNDENTIRQKFYATLGASLDFVHPRWSLSLWGENLTKTKYDTFYFESIGNSFVQRGRPISFGATLRLNIPKI